jgi:hypothetical protein
MMRTLLGLLILLSHFAVSAQVRCDQAQRVVFFNSFIDGVTLPVSLENHHFSYEPVVTISMGKDTLNSPVLQVGKRKVSLQDGPLIVNDVITKGRIEANIQQINSNTIQVSNRIFSRGNIPLMNVRRNIVVTLSFANQEVTRATVTTFPSARMIVNGQSVETPINESLNRFVYSRRP